MRARTITTALLLVASVLATAETIPFTDDHWDLSRAGVTEHLGRQALAGAATLNDATLTDGVIEFDVTFPDLDRRSYPGVLFRVQSAGNHERIYLRPHRAPLYSDAIQYVPAFNGIDGWQLYNGPGYTAPVELAEGEWIHLRLEVKGEQARLFVGSSTEPSLVVDKLERGAGGGGLGLLGPPDGSAYFSEFSYSTAVALELDPPAPRSAPPGIISTWQLSQPLPLPEVDSERHYADQDLPELSWQTVESEPSGLLDISRTHGRIGAAPDCVWARTTLHADADEVRKIQLGYSDLIVVFLNGTVIFEGSSVYRQRDPSFLGIIGPHDAVYLPLQQGDNELLLLVAEVMGGWGFMARDADAVHLADGVERAWEIEKRLAVPEAVVFDPARDLLYVSNFDGYAPPGTTQSISSIGVDGTLRDRDWVTGLVKPTGMAVVGDRLMVVDRRGLAEIDIPTATLTTRHELPGARFANDVAAAPDGTLYVSDSAGHKIYRVRDGAAKVWLDGGEVHSPNGLHVHGGCLIIGNNGDSRVKAADLATGEVSTLARLPEGTIDGLTGDGRGGLLVSHWEGRVYRVSLADGDLRVLIDTTTPEVNIADFGYAAEHDLLVAPTFIGNGLVGYRMGLGEQ
jgi:hypothetical protein